MNRFIGLVIVVVLAAFCAGAGEAQAIPAGQYLGQAPPGFAPEVFAPGIISLPGRYEWGLTFSPGLDECVFGTTTSAWGALNLWYMQMGSDSAWTDPVPAPFQGNGDACFPFYSSDGAEIYFVSTRPNYSPARIWRSSRDGAGWGAPEALEEPVYSGAGEWGSSLTDDGTLYFSSERAGGIGAADLYRTVPLPGGGITVENLGATVNSAQNDGSACIARDGSYLLFESNRPGGWGQADLYITFNEDGVWTEPRNLGPGINTSWIEDAPFVSPDGKYLFFNRRRAWVTSTQTEIWWIDLQVVFHPELSDAPGPGDSTGQGPILRNEPNPFGASTTITYSTPCPGFVTIKVYDVLGREVRNLVNRSQVAGTHTVSCDLPPGERSADGAYFYSLQIGGRTLASGKMVSLI